MRTLILDDCDVVYSTFKYDHLIPPSDNLSDILDLVRAYMVESNYDRPVPVFRTTSNGERKIIATVSLEKGVEWNAL
jgi:hypothetical protein